MIGLISSLPLPMFFLVALAIRTSVSKIMTGGADNGEMPFDKNVRSFLFHYPHSMALTFSIPQFSPSLLFVDTPVTAAVKALVAIFIAR